MQDHTTPTALARLLHRWDPHTIVSLEQLHNAADEHGVVVNDIGDLVFHGDVTVPVPTRDGAAMKKAVAAGKPGGHVDADDDQTLVHIASLQSKLAYTLAGYSTWKMGMGSGGRDNARAAVEKLREDCDCDQ